MIVFLYVVLSLYCSLIIAFIIGFIRHPSTTQWSEPLLTGFSVIIPYRNEEGNFPTLFEGLKKMEYPPHLFEIFLVDDASSDASVTFAEQFKADCPALTIHLLRNKRQSNSPKKDAILTAIQQASKPWIVTTDADCLIPSTWLKQLDMVVQQKQPKMIAGPVRVVSASPRVRTIFEQLDFASLIGSTVGSFGLGLPFMVNGAHLAYEKEAFLNVGGFTDHDHVASGDDVFLLHAFKKIYPKAIHFLKNPTAIVHTKASASWKDLLHQRMRWAAKASAYKDLFAQLVGILVLLGNVAFVIGIVYTFAKAVPSQIDGAQPYLTTFILLKTGVDGLLIYLTLRFLDQTKRFIWYPIAVIFYPLWSFMVVLSMFLGRYHWKGREFSK